MKRCPKCKRSITRDNPIVCKMPARCRLCMEELDAKVKADQLEFAAPRQETERIKNLPDYDSSVDMALVEAVARIPWAVCPVCHKSVEFDVGEHRCHP
jgi:hypothetical protein